jgi:hypothetical protein
MKLVCALKDYAFKGAADAVDVVLYGRADRQTRGSAGASIFEEIAREKLYAAPKAWDFLSLALAATAADLAGHRSASADGWTRQFDIEVSVADPSFWNKQRILIAHLLGFLTTDKWNVTFIGGWLLSEASGQTCPANRGLRGAPIGRPG